MATIKGGNKLTPESMDKMVKEFQALRKGLGLLDDRFYDLSSIEEKLVKYDAQTYLLKKKEWNQQVKTYNAIEHLNKTLDKLAPVVAKVERENERIASVTKKESAGETTGGSSGYGHGTYPDTTNSSTSAYGEVERKQLNFQKVLADLGEKTYSILKTGVALWATMQPMRKIPSALGAAINLLEFGFLLLLKPLADFLYVILMPIARAVVKFAFWLNQQTGFTKRIVQILEVVAVFLLALVGLLGKRPKMAAKFLAKYGGKAAKYLGKRAFKFAGKVIDLAKIVKNKIKKMLKTRGIDIDKLFEKGIKGAKKTVWEWLDGKIQPIKKSVWEWLDEKVGKKAVSVYDIVKGWFDKKVVSVKEILKDLLKNEKGETYLTDLYSPLGKTIDRISELLSTTFDGIIKKFEGFFSKEGINKALTGFLKMFAEDGIIGKLVSKAFEFVSTIFKHQGTGFVATIISAIVGWIADQLPDGVFKDALRFIEDFTFMVGRILDPVNWIWNILLDVYNMLFKGDASFSNTVNELRGIGLDFVNVIIDIYNMLADLAGKLGIHVDKVDRLNTLLGDTNGEVITQVELQRRNNLDLSDVESNASDIDDSYVDLSETVEKDSGTISDNLWKAAQSLIPKNAAKYKGSKKDWNDTTIPTSNGGHIYVPMASGGIVTSPVHALIGESGKEAVIPLNKLDQYLGKSGNNNSSQPVNITVNGIVDESKFRNIVKEEASKIFNSYRRINGATW